MLIIADSGSTKTDWALVENGQILSRMQTQGLNPVVCDEALMTGEMRKVEIPSESAVSEIRFYGAGCRGQWSDKVRSALHTVFPHVQQIEVWSDLLGAAHAVCGHEPGIACILGTGSNSCLYNGSEIIANVPPMGYIIGDEGSGAALGKLFINALYKGMLPVSMREDFLQWASLSYDQLISRIYREPLANRFLASTSLYIYSHLDVEPLRNLVKENFRSFFRCQLRNYSRRDLAVGVVGSIGYHYRELLAEVAAEEGYQMGKILKEPLSGMVEFG
ncbi:MAG: ATPase [Prevotella sp.]|nr:ATPase [Prevotella sp.]